MVELNMVLWLRNESGVSWGDKAPKLFRYSGSSGSRMGGLTEDH